MKIKGIKETQNKLKSLPGKLEKKVLRQALRKAAKLMQAEVKQNTPQGETDDLVDAVKVKAGKRKKDTISMAVEISSDHILPVEFGTQHQPPQGFFRRSIDTKGDECKELAMREIAEGLDKIVKE